MRRRRRGRSSAAGLWAARHKRTRRLTFVAVADGVKVDGPVEEAQAEPRSKGVDGRHVEDAAYPLRHTERGGGKESEGRESAFQNPFFRCVALLLSLSLRPSPPSPSSAWFLCGGAFPSPSPLPHAFERGAGEAAGRGREAGGTRTF